MTLFRRMAGALLAAIFINGLMIATSVAPAQAEIISREQLRLRMLDVCVYQEYRRKNKPDSAVRRCQCASKKASKNVGDSDLNVSRWSSSRGITSGQKSALLAELRGCS